MRQSPMLEFPLSEYESRIHKLISGMEKESLDAVFLTAGENLRYFCGLQSAAWDSAYSTPGALLVDRNGGMAFISSGNGTPLQCTCVDEKDLYFYSRVKKPGIPESYADALYEAFRRLGVDRGRVGMELGTGFRLGLQTAYFLELRQKLSDAVPVDAGRLIWSLRQVKSPLEQERVRTAVAAAETMFGEAFDSVVLGKTTERELFGVMGASAMRSGCEDLLDMVVRFGPERTPQINCPASDMVISATPHAILHLDGGPRYRGYYADIIRQAVVGSLTPQQRELEKIAIQGLEAGMARVKPGVTMKEVCGAIDDYYAAKMDVVSGAYNGGPGWAGHGIGLDVHEEPQISSDSSDILLPGMTLSLEPTVRHPEWGCFCNEQNFIVTETGYELLSTSPLPMRVLE